MTEHIEWAKTQFSLLLLTLLLIVFAFLAYKSYVYNLKDLAMFYSESAKQIMAALFTLITINVAGRRKSDGDKRAEIPGKET